MSHVLEVANVSQHGENSLNHNAHTPHPLLTDAWILGMPVLLGRLAVGNDDHVIMEFVNKMLNGRAVMEVGRLAPPLSDATEMMQDKTALAADNPALVEESFLANMVVCPSLAARMQRFNS